MAEPIIRTENLEFTYESTPPVQALRGIDLSIRGGEYVAIVGANGSGKSTLARHLNALLRPTHGDVWIDGANTREPGNEHKVRAMVQMVFQHPDSQLVATVVEEDVVFGPENFGVPENELPARVRTALEQVDMWAFRQRAPHLLSAGQKQRIAIAGALAVHPRVLVLDEATSMLDPSGRDAVQQILRQLNQNGTTIITITHEMEEAAKANRVVVLHQGRIAMDGAPREVFARANELRAISLDVPSLVDLSLRLGLQPSLTMDELLAQLTARGQCPYSHTSAYPEKGTGDNCQGMKDGGRTTDDPDVNATIGVHPNNERKLVGELSANEKEDPIIRVRQLDHFYLRGLPLESRALDHVDFDVTDGSTMGLIGPTGSGKSTLMQHLNGLLRPQVGSVQIGPYDLGDSATDMRAVRRMVGLVFQQPEDQLFEQYVGDDVAFGPRQYGLSKEEVRERVQWAMELVGLGFGEFKDRMTSKLSGGERRRAALAGVFALRPQVLVADEPTAGLDPRARSEVLRILENLHNEGTTLVIASHRMDDIAALCDHVTALDGGRVLAAGTVREIYSQPDLLQSHGLDVPPVAQVAQALREQGWRIPSGVMDIDELVAALGGA